MDGSIKYSSHEADDAIRYLRVKDPFFPGTPEGTYERATPPRKWSLRGGVAFHVFYERAMYWPASRPSVWAMPMETPPQGVKYWKPKRQPEVLPEAYSPGNTVYLDRTGAPVVLEFSKGCFNDPDYTGDLTATLDLPAMADQISAAVDAVEAASLKETDYRCIDCLIPAAKELIDDAEDVEDVQRFAKALKLATYFVLS